MSLKIIKQDENHLTFLIKNLDLSFTNSIRRVMMSDITAYAFDEIEIKENTTLFHNELLRHRIGLIPVTMGSQMTFGCSYTNNTEEDVYILSDSLVAMDENVEFELMKNIPIAVLRKNETLNFVAKTGASCGSKNIKYSVIQDVTSVKMKRIDKKLVNKELEEYVHKDLYYGRKYLLEKNDVKWENTKIYAMTVNTIMMDPVSVLRITLLKLRRRLVLMKEIDVEEIKAVSNYHNFTINGIDYGIAGIFQNMLLGRKDVKIATYTKKHFLDEFFEFKVEGISCEKSMMKIKEEEMDKAIKIVDKLINSLKVK